jgi:ribosomal protein L37AE/L43A
MSACHCSYGLAWAEKQAECPECGEIRTETNPEGILYCTCQDEEDSPECPSCESANTSEDDGPSRFYCNDCGTLFDPSNDEEVEDWTVDLYCHLEQMTKSEAEEYIYAMLDEISAAAGYRLYYSKME